MLWTSYPRIHIIHYDDNGIDRPYEGSKEDLVPWSVEPTPTLTAGQGGMDALGNFVREVVVGRSWHPLARVSSVESVCCPRGGTLLETMSVAVHLQSTDPVEEMIRHRVGESLVAQFISTAIEREDCCDRATASFAPFDEQLNE